MLELFLIYVGVEFVGVATVVAISERIKSKKIKKSEKRLEVYNLENFPYVMEHNLKNMNEKHKNINDLEMIVVNSYQPEEAKAVCKVKKIGKRK